LPSVTAGSWLLIIVAIVGVPLWLTFRENALHHH